MLLQDVKIHKYKCVEETQQFKVDDNITVLVGMNESGKTSILEAIAKTNYFQKDDDFVFDSTHDYPRKEKKAMEKKGAIAKAVTCTYYISDPVLSQIEDDIGKNVVKSRKLNRTTGYDNKGTWSEYSFDFNTFIKKKTKSLGISSKSMDEKLRGIKSKADYEAIKAEYKDEKIVSALESLGIYFENQWDWNNDPLAEYVVRKYIKPKLPKFLYYDEYYALPSRISIEKLNDETLEDEELKTAKALFDLAEINIDELLQSDDFEDYKAELEATEAIISEELFKYWSTNANLDIEFDIDKKEQTTDKGKSIVEHILDIRVRNRRARMSLPLKNRSKGFNWFFSFLVWFKKIQEDASTKFMCKSTFS